MLLGHKIELRLTDKQKEYFLKSVGIKRFVYNHCLNEWINAYKRGYKPDEAYIRFFYKCLKESNPWINGVSSRIGRGVVDDLLLAFKRFFRKQAKHPQFKKRGVNDSFALREKEKFHIDSRKLRIEKLNDNIKMRQKPRFNGVHKQVTISRKAGKWFASILTDTSENPFTDKIPTENQGVGVDVGIKSLKICSCCGLKKDDLKLADRIFVCANGCSPINRDWNAAKNLLNYGRDWIERDLKRTSELSNSAQGC